MKDHKFTVVFGKSMTSADVRFETLIASSEATATILARAEQFKKGNRCDDVYRVHEHESRPWYQIRD